MTILFIAVSLMARIVFAHSSCLINACGLNGYIMVAQIMGLAVVLSRREYLLQ